MGIIDVSFPKNNEDEMANMAQKVNSKLLFVYEQNTFSRISKSETNMGLIIMASRVKDVTSAKKLARKMKPKFVVASSTNHKTVRYIMEQKWIDFFTNIETSTGRDHTHYRRGNFNQVRAKLAKETGKTYLIDFSRILKVKGRKRALLLGRIMQNIRICKKFGVPISIATMARNKWELRNPKDLQAFLRALKAGKISNIMDIIK